MGDLTGIEWTDATWNPTTGCDQVSAGCDHCYALTMAKRLKGMGSPDYQNDGDPKTSGPGFASTMHPHRLDQPLRWTKPRRIFVNSMSDLFHEAISDEFIAKVFAVMAGAPRHTFQVLTKRHGRMRSLLNGDFRQQVTEEITEMIGRNQGRPDVAFYGKAANGSNLWGPRHWPLPNVWLGVSVENQKWADIRIPALLDTPAAIRFLSCEPLLGSIDLAAVPQRACVCGERPIPPLREGGSPTPAHRRECPALRYPWPDWVIVGGESGPGARPMHPDWARSLRDQCTAAGVPFLFKQHGEWMPGSAPDRPSHIVLSDGRHEPASEFFALSALGREAGACRPFLAPSYVTHVGKHAAGRVLDGRTWDEYPAGAS